MGTADTAPQETLASVVAEAAGLVADYVAGSEDWKAEFIEMDSLFRRHVADALVIAEA